MNALMTVHRNMPIIAEETIIDKFTKKGEKIEFYDLINLI